MELGPAEVVEDAVGELSLEAVDGEKLEIDGTTISIVVADVRDQSSDAGVDAEFFVEFATEGFFRRFAGFDFATGELPLETHGLVGAALADEDLIAAQDEGRHHVADGPVGSAVDVVCGQGGIPKELYLLFLQHFDAAEVVGGFGRIKSVRVQGGGDGVKTAQERGRGRVEPFVANAENVAVAGGLEGVPAALLDDAFEGDSGAAAAPCGEDDVGIGGGYGFGGGGGAGIAEEFATGSFDQFADPRLGVDERFAPFFTVNA